MANLNIGESAVVTERQNNTAKIRELLSRNNLTQVWLINRLAAVGETVDKYEMSSTLACVRTGPKADRVIHKSLEILQVYERRMTDADSE